MNDSFRAPLASSVPPPRPESIPPGSEHRTLRLEIKKLDYVVGKVRKVEPRDSELTHALDQLEAAMAAVLALTKGR